MKSLRLFALFYTAALFGCKQITVITDYPQLTPQVRLTDTKFHSDALNRDMTLRVIVPATITPGLKLPVVLLLHGAGVDYHDWTNHSPISAFAAQNVVLVMPDAAGFYYINEAGGKNRRYEDYLVNELLPEVYRLVPQAAKDRSHTAIVGISRGGYGAAVLGLKHPSQFGFIGDVSGALDMPERPFRWHAPFESFSLNKVLGPQQSAIRATVDPFLLLHSLPRQDVPYVYISCGDKDSLLATNRRFANQLETANLPHEFHSLPGGHDWSTWNAQLPLLETALLAHFNEAAQ